MSIFFNDSEKYVTVELYYYVFRPSPDVETLLIYRTSEESPDKIRTMLKTLKGKFRLPNFYIHSDIIKSCTIPLPDGGATLNYALYKESVLKMLLKQIESDNEKQEITDKNYGNLNPLLGEYLFDVFNRKYLSPDIDLDKIIDEEN